MTENREPTPAQTVELDSMMSIIKSFLEHMEYTLGKDKFTATPYDVYNAVAYAVRDRLVERWLDTQQAYYVQGPKRVYYLSMEFLMGRTLGNSLINLDMLDDFNEAMDALGHNLEELVERTRSEIRRHPPRQLPSEYFRFRRRRSRGPRPQGSFRA